MSVDRNSSVPLILVVDDDLGIQRLLARYLKEQGYLTAVVSDGKSMDKWLQNNQPDLIVLDLMLPGEDGLSLTRRIRSAGNTPIITLTARGEEVDRVIGLEMGADEYLQFGEVIARPPVSSYTLNLPVDRRGTTTLNSTGRIKRDIER